MFLCFAVDHESNPKGIRLTGTITGRHTCAANSPRTALRQVSDQSSLAKDSKSVTKVQYQVKRAIEVSVAGGQHILLSSRKPHEAVEILIFNNHLKTAGSSSPAPPAR